MIICYHCIIIFEFSCLIFLVSSIFSIMISRIILSAGKRVGEIGNRASFATYKTTTGLVGLPVDVNGRETILDLSSKVLESVKVMLVFPYNFFRMNMLFIFQ